MPDRFFLDTNVFVYSFLREDIEKQSRAARLIEQALTTGEGVISWQVVQELLNVATRKFARPLSRSDAQEYLNLILDPLCRIYPSIDLYNSALEIADRWQYGFYDSLIIAAALEANCTILMTEDLQHGQTIRELAIVNPFL